MFQRITYKAAVTIKQKNKKLQILFVSANFVGTSYEYGKKYLTLKKVSARLPSSVIA